MNLSIGINLSTSAAPDANPVRDARHFETLGFDFLTVSDHPQGNHPTFETWTLLTWVAAHTERIGLVPNVLGVPYRPPAIVAKMAESLDRLSGGRLILGLGSGGNDAAIRALGLTVRRPREKLEALGEAIDIMRGLWSEDSFSYGGHQFQLEEARIEPKAQRPIPIWLGVYGPKAIELTGRVADGWSPSLPYVPLPEAKEMRARIRRIAEESSRSADAVVCNLNVGVLVGGRASQQGVVAGSSREVADQMVEFAAAGFTSLALSPLREDSEQFEALGHEVLPEVRRAVAQIEGVPL